MKYYFACIDKESAVMYILSMLYLLVVSDGMRDGSITNSMALQAFAGIAVIVGVVALIFLLILFLFTFKIPEVD
jgi:hypothetical protein